MNIDFCGKNGRFLYWASWCVVCYFESVKLVNILKLWLKLILNFFGVTGVTEVELQRDGCCCGGDANNRVSRTKNASPSAPLPVCKFPAVLEV